MDLEMDGVCCGHHEIVHGSPGFGPDDVYVLSELTGKTTLKVEHHGRIVEFYQARGIDGHSLCGLLTIHHLSTHYCGMGSHYQERHSQDVPTQITQATQRIAARGGSDVGVEKRCVSAKGKPGLDPLEGAQSGFVMDCLHKLEKKLLYLVDYMHKLRFVDRVTIQ